MAQYDYPDAPRSMRHEHVRHERKLMLNRPHVARLTAYAEELRVRGCRKFGSIEVPDFDPLDGGQDARVLFLFEKPGPMTAKAGKRIGSGFVSRDNDDPTAEAIFTFMDKADIPRRLTVLWNVIPWWNETLRITREEMREGVEAVEELISLLPNLRAVVTVGRKAAAARPNCKGLPVLSSDHPSPKVKATLRERWEAIPLKWAKVNSIIASTNDSRK